MKCCAINMIKTSQEVGISIKFSNNIVRCIQVLEDLEKYFALVWLCRYNVTSPDKGA
jgi:hypothetical protein